MVTITINMSEEDLEFIKSTLHKAESNTYVSDRENAQPNKEKIELANKQINQILNRFGW